MTGKTIDTEVQRSTSSTISTFCESQHSGDKSLRLLKLTHRVVGTYHLVFESSYTTGTI
jgi:hypothetical protein